ncbi:30S ribosomal protein S8 [Candidatus Peregrinibacteria bacterium]|nr:30S ribosomal protein S8 [Candidatus Peregrinibacteria bacterium]
MNTDPIADLLTRIRNAARVQHEKTLAPYSKLKVSILDVLKKKNFIEGYKVVKSGTFSEIEIKMNNSLQTLTLKRVSKPGQRIYLKKDEIKPVLRGYGISIISTPKGVMTGEEALKSGVGGEFICEVY